jgi:hypothetical protein
MAMVGFWSGTMAIEGYFHFERVISCENIISVPVQSSKINRRFL